MTQGKEAFAWSAVVKQHMSEIGKRKLVKLFSKINFYWTEKLPANFRHCILLGYILPKKKKRKSTIDLGQ